MTSLRSRLTARGSRQHGFTIVSHRLEIYVKPIDKKRPPRKGKETV